MSELFEDRLSSVMVAGDLLAAWELLNEIEGEERAEAKAWFDRHHKSVDEFLVDLTFAGRDRDEQSDNRVCSDWIWAMCALWLSGPATAARRVPWRSLWDYQNSPGEAAFVHALWDADRAWVADFVQVASDFSLGNDASHANHQLSRVIRAAAQHHDLPCPRGRTFLASWWAGTGQYDTLADRLRGDPFMPDLLFAYLASGHCGDLEDLPAAIADLAHSGDLNRKHVLEHTLEQLTSLQRPKSQRVLAGITDALALRADEVPGGLTFLLGVLSSANRYVLPFLLPLALELTTTDEELREVVTVVIGRPEKGPRETLLAWLKTQDISEKVRRETVISALALLADSEDAAFADRVARAAATLAGSETTSFLDADPRGLPLAGERAAVLGLWDLSPAPNEPEHRFDPPRWEHVLDSKARAYHDRDLTWCIEDALRSIAEGTFAEGSPIRDAVHQRLGERRLSVSRTTRALEELFLGGGMRASWAMAIDVSDAACGAAQRPAGLDGLLRLLARSVAEVPVPGDVPFHIAALADAPGRTNAQMEARTLVAALTQKCRPHEQTGQQPHPPRPTRRGLWDRKRTEVPPSALRLADPADPVVSLADDLDSLRKALAANFNGYSQSYVDVCHWPPEGYGDRTQNDGYATSLTYPDRILAATVQAIYTHGAVRVRGALGGIERQYLPLDVVAAIDTWIAGTLDVTAFWRVAHHSTTQRHLMQTWRDSGITNKELHARRQALPTLAQALTQPDHPDVGALVLPEEIGGAVSRLAFLRAAEALLLAETQPIVLSTPTWADGTIDFDDLLARLHQAGADPRGCAAIGPVDLVQALHRLRPVHSSRAHDVPAGLRTESAFTTRDGVETWDASELVGHWVEQGGLPALDAQPDGNGHCTTTAKAPVPFTRLEALPAELSADPWSPGPYLPLVRMMPRWGDRVCWQAFGTWSVWDPRSFPGLISGPFGVPLHDLLLSLLTPDHNTETFSWVSMLQSFAGLGRLDPDAAVQAALGRHEAGTLRLTLLTRTFQRTFETDAFRGLWPTALGVAAALCGTERKPAGLPALLRLLASYAHEVPDPDVPEGLRQFADSAGKTKSHLEARLLLEALDQARAASSTAQSTSTLGHAENGAA